MPSQFFGLNIAYTGLTAANAAINTTGNNISNVETKGYSRQRVNQQAALALRTYTSYGSAGAGVDTMSIERTRDAFYDFKYWNNNGSLGEQQELEYYMRQIQDYFRDDSTIEGFTTIFNRMYTGLSEVAKNAGDPTTKSQFLGFAESFAYYFNSMAANLEKLQRDVNMEIKTKVDEINTLATEIASLNKQINVIELTGAMANELRDQRDLLIDKLSLIVDVEVTETPVYDSNYPDRVTGANNYMVRIAGGQVLVDSNDYNELVCEARENYETVNQSDALGLYEIYWKDGRDFNIYNAQMKGELRGLIEMRDGNNSENFRGTVSDIATNADGKTEVTIATTAAYLATLNKCTLSDDGGVITLGNQSFVYDSFRVNYDADGNITDYVFVISDDAAKNYIQPDVGRLGKDAEVGDSVAYQGIPYYQQQLNEWVRSYAEAFNRLLTEDGAVDGYNNPADILWVANAATDDTQLKFLDSRNGNTVISSTDDSYYRLTAKNFAVAKEMIADSELFSTHTGATAGQDKYDVIDKLISLKTDKTKMTFRGCGASEFLQCVLSDVALNTSSAITQAENFTNIEHSIETQRASVSGVDSDEEALNLVKFQHSYSLASKMIQVLTEVYDRLILQTGV